MQAKKAVNTVTTRTFELQLNGRDIIDCVRQELKAQGGHNIADLPDNAEVTFYVPGGGDWSNTSIDITDEYPIRISWKITDHAHS